jgi:hypothetical protein
MLPHPGKMVTSSYERESRANPQRPHKSMVMTHPKPDVVGMLIKQYLWNSRDLCVAEMRSLYHCKRNIVSCLIGGCREKMPWVEKLGDTTINIARDTVTLR